jgi:hypothetical protein
MKSLCLVLAFAVVVSVAGAGYIDTDGYYVMDSVELSAYNGSVSPGPVTLTFDGLNGTISGINSAANSYWIPFNPASLSLLPSDLSAAGGWKLTFTNTSTAGIQFELVVATTANGWQQNVPTWVDPGQTGTVRSDNPIIGAESMTNYILVLSVPPAGPDVLTFTVAAQDKSLPWSPNPADDPAGLFDPVLPQVVLTWNTAMVADLNERPNPNIRKHFVLGNFANPADPNMVLVGQVDAGDPVGATAQYPASGSMTLDDLTVYKWQIIEGLDDGNGGVIPYNDANNIVGPVWTFQTASYLPIILNQLQYTAVNPTETAVFTAEFFSLQAITANKWFWSEDNGATFTELANGAHPSGSGSAVAITMNEGVSPKTSTLTITNSAAGDDGWYYCTLANSYGTSEKSNNAGLAVKRQVAYYMFEGDLTDSSAEGNDGIAKNNDPNIAPDISYGAGVSGGATQAVLLNANSPLGSPNYSYIEIPAAGYPKPSPGGAMEAGTIMFWYKSMSWGSIIGTTNNVFALNLDANLSLYVNGTTPALNFYIPDDTWNFGAIRWQLGGQTRLYAGHLDQNGVSSTVIASAPMVAFADLTDPVTIGARTDLYNTVEYFTINALIDDLKIYNYPMTDAEIAAAYNAVSGQGLCAATYANQYDFDGDCIVSLADFAALASEWLSCGVLPNTACGN